MRPAIATLESVEAAIRTIKAKGKEPTSTRVLEITGGNKATVLRHMKTLGFALSRPEPDSTDDVVPALLIEKARPFLSELMTFAAELERAKYTTFTERYHRGMEELEAALEEQGAELDTLAAKEAALASERDTLRDELELAQLERDELRDKFAAAERRAREAEMRVLELEAVNKSIELAAASSADLEARLLRLVDEKMRSLAVHSS